MVLDKGECDIYLKQMLGGPWLQHTVNKQSLTLKQETHVAGNLYQGVADPKDNKANGKALTGGLMTCLHGCVPHYHYGTKPEARGTHGKHLLQSRHNFHPL